MKQGDFTDLAKAYVNRPGYSHRVLRLIASHIGAFEEGFKVADVGAGTGKLTADLNHLGLSGSAIEPNASMRAEGIEAFRTNPRFKWLAGSAEETGLADKSVGWVLMGSSFHWTDPKRSLSEFHRILKVSGHFTALWNPRDIENDEMQKVINAKIHEIVPELKRVSSGSKQYMSDIEKSFRDSGLFGNLLFIESPHVEAMTTERYLGAWRSVNDIQAQAGKDRFEKIMNMISKEIHSMHEVKVTYRTRAWTVQAIER